ncbi:MAG TPA: ABC transporter substrate binding protein [Gallionellaceae bacterium]|nr:ABC transporter substrate binding protein [Gallionellaceae bacterium]
MSRQYFSAIRPNLTGLIALIFLLPAFSYAAPLKLTLVLSEQGGAYQEYSNALGTQLDNKNVTLSVIDADKPLPHSDLVIAAGMKASITVARSKPAAMLAVLIPKDGYNRLLPDPATPLKGGASAMSAIYLDQPFKRQLDLITAVLPNANTIAVLYSTQHKEISTLRTLLAARKFDLNERSISSVSELNAALQSLLISSDVLLALPDAEIYNTSTIRNILLATYRSKIPLVGFSPAYVKAGALCAVFSTPEQIAAQSLGIILAYAETRALPAATYAKEFEVSVNEQVARSLGLNIKSVSQLRSEIGLTP